ncbi:MAG: DNA polymerase I, partial [Bacteroidia bacterium]
MTEQHTPERKLYLLDAMALIYRAHFAFIRAPRINSKGMNTSAIYGFTNTLLEILNNEKPSHIGIVYDTDKPTFRHDQFAEYKANRQSRPEDITIAIPYIYKMSTALGIPNLFVDGYEADDVIGALAKKAACTSFQVYMMTPDKDYAQLVGPCIYQHKPGFMGNPAEILDEAAIKRKWEVENVEQVIDILGLMGDAVDNIPGIPGVGEKTAKKLIKEFGSVENIIANQDKLTGKLKELVATHAQQAIMSKELATININVPIELDEHALELSPPNLEMLRELFNELEFRALGRRFFTDENDTLQDNGGSKTSKPAKVQVAQQPGLFDFAAEEEAQTFTPTDLKTLKDVPHEYKLIQTPEERKELVEYLKGFDVVCFDTETSNLNPHDCDIVGFSFAVKPSEAFYISTPGPEEADKKILEEFREIFESEQIEKVGQNIKYDIQILKNYDLQMRGPLFDTMLAHYLIDPDKRHGMDFLANIYLGYSPIPIENLIGKGGKKQLSMAQIPAEIIKDYAAEDADVTLQLREKLKPELAEVNAEKLLKEVELPLVYVLADMEREGIRLDSEALRNFSEELRADLRDIEADIYGMADATFNLNSPMQLGEILFDKLKLDPKAKRTAKSKQYSTGEDVLSVLAMKHDIAKKILEYRSLQKLKSTYVDALPLLVNRKTGRIHTSYNQAVAATGRLSSTDPNLQNIPIRTEKGREIRKAFIPRDENH